MKPSGRAASWATVGALYALCLSAQTWNLGKVLRPALDEGVYLHSARLLLEGRLPYRDFFLSHTPFPIFGAAAGLFVCGHDVPLFSALYAAWVFSALFPLFAIVEEATESWMAATLSAALFATFPEFALWDARFFAIRQASTPFLAFALYFLLVRRRPVPAGILLGLFAWGVATHAALGLVLCAGLLAGERRPGAQAFRTAWERNGGFVTSFLLTAAVGYGSALALPGAVDGLLGFQLARPVAPWAGRIRILVSEWFPSNAAIVITGLAGSLAMSGGTRFVGLVNLVGLPLLIFGSRSFYPHYLVSLAIPLAVASGLLFQRLLAVRMGRWIVPVAVAAAVVVTGGRRLVEDLSRRTPDLFRAVEALRGADEPVLCFEPIYALYARRRITPHYFEADMRSYRLVHGPLPDDAWENLLKRSRTVFVEPRLASFLTPARRKALEEGWDLVFSDRWHRIYVRRAGKDAGLSSGGTPPAAR